MSLLWQGDKVSNLVPRGQSAVHCRYAIALYISGLKNYTVNIETITATLESFLYPSHPHGNGLAPFLRGLFTPAVALCRRAYLARYYFTAAPPDIFRKELKLPTLLCLILNKPFFDILLPFGFLCGCPVLVACKPF